MFLFFDTETTGLPVNWSAPISALSNWPRMVQIAWILTDDSGNELGQANYIIKPDGFTIPPEASNIHGITTARALAEGHQLQDVLANLSNAVDKCRVLVAHNMEFDRKIVAAEYLRLEIEDNFLKTPTICTKEKATEFCRLPGNYGGYKWPTLQELHCKLFEENIANAHDAYVDVKACLKCFFALRDKGIIVSP